MANRNGCEYCLALHGRILRGLRVPAPTRDALLGGGALDGHPRLDALRRFTHALLDAAGDVSDDAWSAFLGAGFGRAQALEVVLGVGAYTLTTFANRLTQAPVE